MNFEKLRKLANQATLEIAAFKIPFVLSPEKLMRDDYAISALEWASIRYADTTELDKIPANRRGVYAFVVCTNNEMLPMHGYVLYIGIAGKNSSRSLRERYQDYLKETYVRKNAQILQMIGNWHPVLRFFFAPVDNTVTSEKLQTLEKQLNGALMPPYSDRDIEAGTKQKRRAFRV